MCGKATSGKVLEPGSLLMQSAMDVTLSKDANTTMSKLRPAHADADLSNASAFQKQMPKHSALVWGCGLSF